ncbi:MAG: PepSY-associated TM helix domain-containing protein [Ramlibacter sp.]
MQSATSPSSAESALYRRVWRWHFYAGLICLPFLALLAATGALYLFKDPVESWVYSGLRHAPGAPGAAALDAQALIDRALQARPGQPVRYNAPAEAGRSAEVGIRTPAGTVGVYLDPASGRVLGELPDDERLMDVVKRLHTLLIVGKAANYWVEIVAGWAIVLVVSGVFLWWPRGRKAGVYSMRGRPAQRTWWRDLHAVVGAVAAAAILFLAVTGMPWSAYWGQQFGRITSEWGIGLPKYLFGPGPASAAPLAGAGTSVPWLIAQAPVPQSAAPHDSHAGHGGHGQADAAVPLAAPAAPSIGINRALQIFESLGVPAGTPVSLPSGPRGTYAAMRFPDDVREQRVVHLDRYAGAVLSDVGYRDYGVAGRAIEWGINIHTGLQFGWVNQLVMLAACLSIITLAVSSAVMWWKRRPRGRLAAPPRRAGDRAAMGAIAVAAALGLFYPLLGASMLVALLVDALVPAQWHERWGL